MHEAHQVAQKFTTMPQPRNSLSDRSIPSDVSNTKFGAGVGHQGGRLVARWGWSLRHALGKPLNFVRLMKSAYTFDGGVDYLIWKIERHSGVRMGVTPWQRRHPILASPYVLWQLKKRGAIR